MIKVLKTDPERIGLFKMSIPRGIDGQPTSEYKAAVHACVKAFGAFFIEKRTQVWITACGEDNVPVIRACLEDEAGAMYRGRYSVDQL